MVFNSVVFLFCFLPLSLLLYYLVPGRAKMQCCWQKAHLLLLDRCCVPAADRRADRF